MKKIITIVLLIIIIIGCATFIFYGTTSSAISLKKDSFQFEYGVPVFLRASDVLDTDNEKILNSFEVDTSKFIYKNHDYPEVGQYDCIVSYTKRNKEISDVIKVNIKDSTPPKFTKIPESITIEQGNDSSLVSNFEAKDLSSFDIKIDTNQLDVNVPGEYEITVNAIDSYKNTTSQTVKVIVKPKQEVVSNNVVQTPTTNGPRYVKGILIVNKKNPVPSNYAPGEDAQAVNQLRLLIQDMQRAGLNISNSYSGYRSYNYQANLYQNYVNNYGQVAADTFSARPGYSEHQTGLAFDLLHQDGSLVENTPEANWIAQNAHRYGFIVRYQAGKEAITGYQAEPWHIRYVGSIATDIYQSGLTLEEYLGVAGGEY